MGALFWQKSETVRPDGVRRQGLRECFFHGCLRQKGKVRVLFGPVYDPCMPQSKKLVFGVFILVTALVLYVQRSGPQRQFVISALLAVIAVRFVLVMYVFH